MALKAILDSIEGLDASVAKEYEQITEDGELKGKYRLSVESVGGLALENVSGLKSALEKERGENAASSEKLKAYGDISPTKAKDGVAALNKLAKFDPEKEADKLAEEKANAKIAQIQEKHKTEKEGLEQTAGKYRTQVEKILIDSTAETAITKAGGDPALLGHIVKSQMKLKENEDGSFSVQIVNKDGHARVKDSSGAPMAVDDLVGEMRTHDSYSKAFAPEGRGGPGGDRQQQVPSGAGGTSRAKMSTEDKASYIDKHGYDKFMALPD